MGLTTFCFNVPKQTAIGPSPKRGGREESPEQEVMNGNAASLPFAGIKVETYLA